MDRHVFFAEIIYEWGIRASWSTLSLLLIRNFCPPYQKKVFSSFPNPMQKYPKLIQIALWDTVIPKT